MAVAFVSLALGFGVWYFNAIPKTSTLQNTVEKYGNPVAANSGVVRSQLELDQEKQNNELVYLNGVCNPFQKNIQVIKLSKRKNSEFSQYLNVTVYLLNKPDGKVINSISFNSSKDYLSTENYIKSNCLAEIFFNKEKYRDIYLNDGKLFLGIDSVIVTDYSKEYQLYLIKQKNLELEKQYCGDPSLINDLYDDYTFTRKVDAETLRKCSNAHNNLPEDTSLEQSVGSNIYPQVLDAIAESQKLP